MSLNQHYTWADFLREHPEIREKGLKRTSPEATKAFDAAFKKRTQALLKERAAELEAAKKR